MSYISFTFDKITYTDETIVINSFNLNAPGKELLTDATLSMSPGNIYGLIGKNGSGKSTLLKQILQLKNTNDNYSIKINTLYVEQEIDLDERLPIDFVLDSNYKQIKSQTELDELQKNAESDNIDEMDINEFNFIQHKIEELTETIRMWNPDLERVKAQKILYGLGFTTQDLEKSSNLFSGGWQMRISLARCLYLEPELLLLDEPTNHLDLEAIIWLSDYLNSWKQTVIVVSHNIGFLNEVCDYILNIENKKLIKYEGNYNSYKINFGKKIREAEKEWHTFDKKLKEIKKKGDKKKVDEFMKKNSVQRPEKLSNINIEFEDPYKFKGNIISLNNVSFGYNPDNLILSNVSLGIDMETKVAFVGPNGSGKSTLIKLMTGEIQPISGEITVNSQCRIGYYNQHFENQLPVHKTPVEYLKIIIPEDYIKVSIEQSIRSFLGQVNLEASAHHKSISELSGGQKARVALVKLIFLKPHCLILDEPTNHLDIETVGALINGLVNFNGAVIVITHEPELIKQFDDTVWMMDSEIKKINPKINTYDKYVSYILQEN